MAPTLSAIILSLKMKEGDSEIPCTAVNNTELMHRLSVKSV